MRRFVLPCLLLTFCQARLFSVEVFFDFGDSSQQTQGNVNNLTKGATSVLSLTAVKDSTGADTIIGIAVTGFHGGSNTNGTTLPTGAAAALFTSQSTRDNFFGSTGAFNGFTAPTGTLTLSGLDGTGATTYNFDFFGSRTAASDNRETEFSATGQNTVGALLDTANNTSNTTLVSGVIPTAAGTITITVDPGPGNTNSSGFFYLGAMRLTSTNVSGPQPIVFSEEPPDRTVLQGTPATFTAAVSNEPPFNVQWLLNGLPIEGANSLTYTTMPTTLGMDGERYSVRVSNGPFEKTSRQALLQVTPDTVRPAAVSATTANRSFLSLVFSKTLDPSTAEVPQNYLLQGGALSVIGARLQPDGKTVVVNLDGLLTGAWTMLVENVSDLVGNSVAAGTTFNGPSPSLITETMLFDFGEDGNATATGPSPDDPVNAWNSVTATLGANAGMMLSGLVTVENNPTEASLEILSRFAGANGVGTNQAGSWPIDAMRDSLFGNTELFGTLANVTPAFRLTGLDSRRVYELTFFASRTGVAAGEIRSCVYTVTGASTARVSLDAANNLTNTAVLAGLTPDAQGHLTIRLTPGPDNNNSNHFVYLGLMKVQSAPNPGPPQIISASVADGQLTLVWNGTGALQTSTSLVQGSWTTINPSPVSPWQTSIDPANPRRFYRLAY